MATVPNELLVELRNTFRNRLSLSELADLCQDLGLNIENLPGTSLSEKSRELAAYIGRRDLVSKLATVGPNLLPDIPWLEILGRYGYGLPPDADSGDSAAPATTVSTEDLQRLSPILAHHSEFNTPGARRDMLAIAGVLSYLDVDLSGSTRQVANAVLLRLNDRGQIAPGDYALGRLLNYLLDDETLPEGARAILVQIVARYGLNRAA
ncbi:MAG: hypothetical protein K1X50_09170 [Candidatus Promineofilum sp.]|nr:hypothetical protein [Promineifilum sp.]MCW5864291.1 hypothetical protein [Anaerolineae bacterium]